MGIGFLKRIGVVAAGLLALPCPALAQDMSLKALCAPSEETDPQPLHINGATPYIYKSVNGVDLRLHVFTAAGLAPGVKAPAAVFYFGGGWIFGDIRRFQTQATHLALHGMTTVLVDYRVKCRHGTTLIDATSDAKSAMRWVRGHAGELGIDPARIAAVGSSAGGHLALATALITAFDDPADPKVDARPNALVLYAPGTDLGSPAAIGAVMKLQGKDVAERGPDFSPMQHLDRGLPPTLIFQGTADRLLEPTMTFCDRARAMKYQCDVVTYTGAPHGFAEVWMGVDATSLKLVGGDASFAGKTEGWAQDASDRTDAFFRKLGWLP